tara:strand:- start:263 stop:1492 length:1230 start_codon:yes stop_codon:yes gene_type:complete
MNTNFDDIESFVNTTPGLLQLTGGTITGAIQLNNTLTLGTSGAGHDVKLWGDTALDYFEWDADTNKLTIEGANGTTAIDVSDGNVVIGDGSLTVVGTANLDAVDIDGAVQIDGTVTVGVNDTGYDVKLWGATTGKYVLWDEDQDELVLALATKLSFHDQGGGENVVASADGHLEVNAGTTLDITAPTVDINASSVVNIDGALTITGDYDLTMATSNTQILAAASGSSTSGAVTYSFYNDPDLGIARTNTNQMTFCSGGANIASVTTDGLTFGNDSAAANALDDYEEGTWTPTVAFGGTACTISSGLTNKYTKVGNLVHCIFTFATTNLNGGTGALELGGLPFANASAFSYGTVVLGPATMSTGYSFIQIFVNAAATAFFVIQHPTGTSTFGHTETTLTSNYYGQLTYYV